MYEALLAIVLAIASHWTVQAIAAWVLLDVVSGIMASWRTGTFRLKRIADFLTNDVSPLLLTYAACRIVVLARPEWEPIALLLWATIQGHLTGSILDNIRELTGKDVPTPQLRE